MGEHAPSKQKVGWESNLTPLYYECPTFYLRRWKTLQRSVWFLQWSGLITLAVAKLWVTSYILSLSTCGAFLRSNSLWRYHNWKNAYWLLSPIQISEGLRMPAIGGWKDWWGTLQHWNCSHPKLEFCCCNGTTEGLWCYSKAKRKECILKSVCLFSMQRRLTTRFFFLHFEVIWRWREVA